MLVVRRLILAVAIPVVVAAVPGTLVVGVIVLIARRLLDRNRVQLRQVHSFEVHSPRVTLLSFPPRRQPWVRA